MLLELVPPLARLVPPAVTIDKRVYSPFSEPAIWQVLRERHADTLVITGAETDMCVLAAVMDAVDYGFRVVLATDAICSSSDRTHDALMTLYHNRFSEQIETVTSEAIIDAWPLTLTPKEKIREGRKKKQDRRSCQGVLAFSSIGTAAPKPSETSLNSGPGCFACAPCVGRIVRKSPHRVTRFFRASWFFRRRPASRLQRAGTAANRRVAMRLSQYFLPLLRENPSEAQIVSHRLMLRAGMIRQSSRPGSIPGCRSGCAS